MSKKSTQKDHVYIFTWYARIKSLHENTTCCLGCVEKQNLSAKIKDSVTYVMSFLLEHKKYHFFAQLYKDTYIVLMYMRNILLDFLTTKKQKLGRGSICIWEPIWKTSLRYNEEGLSLQEIFFGLAT
jgi:hypothetical protein